MNVINSNSVMAMRAAILQQNSALREAASAASAPASPVSGASAPASTDFGAAMKSALSEVNALQGQSSDATAAYERGETTDIAAVILAKKQASNGFEAPLQVRNKLLSAYKVNMSKIGRATCTAGVCQNEKISVVDEF